MQSKNLNYKHLKYFHVVAREGGVIKAAESLHLTPQTISGQLTQLEESLQLKLFAKVGRSLKLTPSGQMVLRYADQIFGLGDQLLVEMQDEYNLGLQRITIGILDSIPKIIAYEILKPVLENDHHVITCEEGGMEKLLADLSVHRIDMVLADVSLNSTYSVKAYSHLLGESSLSCFAVPELAARYRKNFPESLAGAPLLLPRESSFLGRELHKWLQQQNWHVRVRGYFDDSALLKVFGQAGVGLFFMPTVIGNEICTQYGLKLVGHIPEIRDRYFAITSQRSLKNPLLETICTHARQNVFTTE